MGMDDRTLETEIGRYWDERAESYSNGVRGELHDARGAAWRRALERVSGTLPAEASATEHSARALDLGCGPGFFCVLLAQMGYDVVGVDASDEMLLRARANVAAAGLEEHVSLHCGDVGRLPFEDGTFDLAASRNLTWLMRDPRAAYAEWLRVLRPGGKLVVFDANWYRYLVDEDVDARRRADQEGRFVVEWDEDARATTAEERRCEVLAAQLPLTPVMRPAWDLDVLAELGASHVGVDEGVWRDLWTQSECEFYATSPLFMVEAVKGGA